MPHKCGPIDGSDLVVKIIRNMVHCKNCMQEDDKINCQLQGLVCSPYDGNSLLHFRLGNSENDRPLLLARLMDIVPAACPNACANKDYQMQYSEKKACSHALGQI